MKTNLAHEPQSRKQPIEKRMIEQKIRLLEDCAQNTNMEK